MVANGGGAVGSVRRGRWHQRVFKALREGYRQGYAPRHAGSVSAKELGSRPVVAAMEGEESVAEFVDRGLQSGRIDTVLWGLEDGKEKE